MSERHISENYSQLVSVLAFLFTFFVNINNHAANTVLLFLVITGIYALKVNAFSPFKDRGLNLLMVITLGYYLINLIIYCINGTYIFKFLQTDLYFLLAIFVAISIASSKININLILLGFKLSLILLGVGHLLYIDVSNIYISISAPITVLSMFLSVVNFDNDNLTNKIFSLVAFAFGLMIVIDSGIRLAWLVFMVLSMLFTWTILASGGLRGSLVKAAMVCVILVAVVFSVLNSQKIDSRIVVAIDEISSWSDGSKINSSVGLRLEMYKTSIEAFKERPLFGHGYLMGTKEVSKYVDKSVKSKVHNFVQLHSEYLTTLLEKGLIGLVALGFLLLKPLLIVIRSYDINNIFIRIGIVTSISFVIFGVFNVSFGDTTYKSLYVFLICLYLPEIYNRSHHLKTTRHT